MARKLRAVLFAVAIAVLGTVLSVATAAPVAALVGLQNVETIPGFAALFVAAYVGYALAGVWYLRYSGRGLGFLDVAVPDRRALLVTVVGTVGLFVALVAIGYAIELLDVPSTPHNLFEPGFDPTLLLVLIPLVLFVNAPVEEFLFRNVIQKALYESFSRTGAILVTSAVFALVHLPAYYNPNLLATGTSLGIVFLGSCVFGLVYARTDNLVVPSAVHGLFNAIQIALFYLVVTAEPTLELL